MTPSAKSLDREVLPCRPRECQEPWQGIVPRSGRAWSKRTIESALSRDAARLAGNPVAEVRLYPAGAGQPEAYTPRMPALQRVEAERAVREGFRCSFCGNEPADGRDLIAGPQVFICDECIATCADMLAGEDGAGDEERPEPDRGNPDGNEPASRPTVFRLLTEGDVARLLTMDDLIDEMGVTPQPVRRCSPYERSSPSAARTTYLP